MQGSGFWSYTIACGVVSLPFATKKVFLLTLIRNQEGKMYGWYRITQMNGVNIIWFAAWGRLLLKSTPHDYTDTLVIRVHDQGVSMFKVTGRTCMCVCVCLIGWVCIRREVPNVNNSQRFHGNITLEQTTFPWTTLSVGGASEVFGIGVFEPDRHAPTGLKLWKLHLMPELFL